MPFATDLNHQQWSEGEMSQYEGLLAMRMMDSMMTGVWRDGSYDCDGETERLLITRVCVAFHLLLKV